MPNLALPDDRSVVTYKNVVKILRSDDVLRGVIQTWQLGEEGEEEWAPPTETALPCLRLIPNITRTQQADEEAYMETLEILFDFTVAGVDPADRMNLWTAIRNVFSITNLVTIKQLADGTPIPDGSIMLNVMRLCGCSSYRWETPGTFQYDPRVTIPIVNQRCLARLAIKLFAPS